MRLRSTGLGRTELEAEVATAKKVDDMVIFFAKVTKPVKWKLRMGFQEKDLRALFWAVLKPRNLWFIIKALTFTRKNVSTTENF
jgi:hypothetical protein